MTSAPLLIVEKYEQFLHYCYPIAQNIERRHGVAKQMFLTCLLGQVELFVSAAKTDQLSRAYQADAGLANLRYWLRFLTHIRAVTPKQHQTASLLLAEPGKLLGAWILRKKGKG